MKKCSCGFKPLNQESNICPLCGSKLEDDKYMTNYECYFGTQERAIDSLSLLLDFPDHPRKEVREWQKEVREVGTVKWLESECVNQRWWNGIPLEK